MIAPAQVMTRALSTGTTRAAKANRPPDFDFITRPAYTNSNPTAVSAAASPTLNAITSSNPYPTRCSDIDARSTTRAEGHGNRPPEMPSATRLRHVIGDPSDPGGRCEWLCPP